MHGVADASSRRRVGDNAHQVSVDLRLLSENLPAILVSLFDLHASSSSEEGQLLPLDEAVGTGEVDVFKTRSAYGLIGFIWHAHTADALSCSLHHLPWSCT